MKPYNRIVRNIRNPSVGGSGGTTPRLDQVPAKDESFCISFYGWNKTDLFMGAWRSAGLRIVERIVFREADSA
ncbi:MAG: hypothetical protein WAN65_14565 [Candidatus Sulfotelmatobacter sp.]